MTGLGTRIKIGAVIMCMTLGNALSGLSASAQYDTYLQRQQDLITLSGIFGQLHHIRRTCEPRREANIWRQRMQTMVELEEPARQTHIDMFNAFNAGFRAMEARYRECTREAQATGKDLAYSGRVLIDRLTANLESDENLETSGDPL